MFDFDYEKQYFTFDGDNLEIPKFPLTVTLQINRQCNLHCVYCSEHNFIPDITYYKVEKFIENLSGVKRIIISGGEPLLHKELIPIVKLCRKKFDVVALATNGVLMTPDIVNSLKEYIDYFDITIDGLRKIHNNIRGCFDGVLKGIATLKSIGCGFSIVTVLFNENKEVINYIAVIADSLGAQKLKLLSPIPKGKGKEIIQYRLDKEMADSVFNELKKLKYDKGMNIKIAMTDWDSIKEGHAILIHPDGKVVASPVWSNESCIELIGDINVENICSIWERYPYKINHLNKYIEKTMRIV